MDHIAPPGTRNPGFRSKLSALLRTLKIAFAAGIAQSSVMGCSSTVGTVAENAPERTRLFKNGDFHFNTEGEYLQGLVWTATLFGVDVTKCRYRPEVVDAERAEVLRNTVMRNISK